MRPFAAGPWICLALVASCDAEEPAPNDCPSAAPTLELGSGAEAFTPLADGDPLAFHLGPQGGYHVFASLRATGLAEGDPTDPFGPESPLVTLEVWVDGARIGASLAQPRLFDAGELVGQRVVLEVPDPPSLEGVAAVLSAEVEDRCGGTAADERSVELMLAIE